jgi:hypothetical protein
MNILMLVNYRTMNCLIAKLLDFYTSSNCFLDMLAGLISSHSFLTSKRTSGITRPAANFSNLSCHINFTFSFRRIANIKILLATSFRLHCTLTLNKNFKLNSVRSCKRYLYNQSFPIKLQLYFRQSFRYHSQWGLNKGLKNSNNHLMKLFYVELKTLLLKIKHNMKDITEHSWN